MNRAEHNANQCRIDYRITELPLRLSTVIGLVERMGGAVKTYLQAEDELKRRNIASIMEAKPDSGFAVINQKGEFTVYLADSLDESRKIFIIAHEIGHYCCGHLAFLPLGMSDRLDDAQEVEANDFARTLMAPPYFLYRTKCGSIEKIQQRTLLDLDNALRVLALVHSENNRHPTRQERQLYDMMMGARKFVPIAVGSGIAAFVITGVILLSVLWKPSRYKQAIGPAAESGADQSSHSISSAVPVSSSKPSSELAAAYQEKGQSIRTKIAEIDDKISSAAENLEAVKKAKGDLEWAYEQLATAETTAEHVLADLKTLIAAREKEANLLTAELEKLEDQKRGLIRELSELADQYLEELMGSEQDKGR